MAKKYQSPSLKSVKLSEQQVRLHRAIAQVRVEVGMPDRHMGALSQLFMDAVKVTPKEAV